MDTNSPNVGAYHPFGKGRVARIEETADQYVTIYQDEDGQETDRWHRWKPSAYVQIEGTYFAPDEPLALAALLAGLQTSQTQVIIHWDGQWPDIEVGCVGRTGGSIKAPIFVPLDDVGGEIMMLSSILGLYDMQGAPLYQRKGPNPWSKTSPMQDAQRVELAEILHRRPQRPLILHCRTEPYVVIGSRESVPTLDELLDQSMGASAITFQPWHGMGFIGIILEDVLEVLNVGGDVLWQMPISVEDDD